MEIDFSKHNVLIRSCETNINTLKASIARETKRLNEQIDKLYLIKLECLSSQLIGKYLKTLGYKEDNGDVYVNYYHVNNVFPEEKKIDKFYMSVSTYVVINDTVPDIFYPSEIFVCTEDTIKELIEITEEEFRKIQEIFPK